MVALHCTVEGNDGGAGEFSVRGPGHRVLDPAAWELVRPGHADEFNTRYVLFELDVRQALSTTYQDDQETRTRWSAGEPSAAAEAVSTREEGRPR